MDAHFEHLLYISAWNFMFRSCFSESGRKCLESVQGTMKSQEYQGLIGAKCGAANSLRAWTVAGHVSFKRKTT